MASIDEQQSTREELDHEFALLRQRRRRRRDASDIDITPMIDIVFLLLIYFVVASKLEQGATVDLPKARFGEPIAGTKAVVLVVQHGGSTGAIRVLAEDGTEIGSGDPDQQQDAIALHVLKGLLGQAEGVPKETVLIKAERDLKQRQVDRVLQAMGRVKVEFPALDSVYIAVLETK
jgi:biopolymer transport protein ExbD